MGNLCRSSAKAAAQEATSTSSSQKTPLVSRPEGRADDEDSVCSTLAEGLPLFARSSDDLRVINLVVDEGASLDAVPSHTMAAPRLAAWSPDSELLAVVDPAGGLITKEVLEPGQETMHTLSKALTNVQHLQWSPRATYLVTQSPFKNESIEPNVHSWKRIDKVNKFVEDMSFISAKVEKDTALLKWTVDEKFCCRCMPDGNAVLLNGTDLSKPPLATLPWDKPVQAVEFAPPSNLGDCLCAFTMDTRDAMQRVTAAAEIAIFRLSGQDQSATPVIARTIPIEFGQQADLKWSPSGTSVLAHCQTDIDDSGQSYYGGAKLVLISRLEKYTLDLTEAKDSVVQAVEWCPNRDEFVLIQGFQPAKATLWKWDSDALKCSMVSVLHDSAHRNTIRWNHFGSLVCVAGFGNLAGQMTFFGRAKNGMTEISSCEASCAVSAEWAPDGRHFLTATVAPRMRVDNGFGIWSALHGVKVAELSFGELFEIQWRPEASESDRFSDVTAAEIELVLSGASTLKQGPKKQAYRPPSGRSSGDGTDGNKVAMMMRGELGGTTDAPTAPRKSSNVDREEPKEQKATNSRPPDADHGSKAPCPKEGWEYIDPKGNKQGPFKLEQMKKWFDMGVFKADLKLRCDPNDRFISLRELFPHPMVPFLRAPRRPVNFMDR